MKRVVVIGDIHGLTTWNGIVKKFPSETIVFLGDYFDSHENISAYTQIENFKNIIEFKKKNNDNTILLFGNHDYHYFRGVSENYSGYQKFHKFDIQEQLEKNRSHLQACYSVNNTIFSHAGITQTWMKNNKIESLDQINQLFLSGNINIFKFSGPDMFGDDITQSPIWVRERSLLIDSISGNHIVGHTRKHSIEIKNKDNNKLVFCDSLFDENFVLLEIEDNDLTVIPQKIIS